MTFVQVGDQILNLDQVAGLSTQRGAGSAGLLAVRVHFADGRHVDFHDDGADALMAVVAARLAGPAVAVKPPPGL